MLHVSRSGDITDRTKYLLGEESVNPAQGMLRTVACLHAAATATEHRRLVISVPCGTFHSQPIFDVFLNGVTAKYDTSSSTTEVKIVSMVDEVKVHLKERVRPKPGADRVKTIAVMSTTGTRKAGLYNKAFEAEGYRILQVS